MAKRHPHIYWNIFFQNNGHKTGVLRTVSWRWPAIVNTLRLTTPDVLEIHSMLQEMEDAGCDGSNNGSIFSCSGKKVDGPSFVGVIFTNLPRTILISIKNMESYFMAKARLFYDLLLANKKIAINSDDKWGASSAWTMPLGACIRLAALNQAGANC